MEYLVLVGTDLKLILSRSLGETAPFFWSYVAPVVLALLWAGGLYGLWENWFRKGEAGKEEGRILVKLGFSLLLVSMVLCSGAALEHLVFGDPLIHSQVLGRLIEVLRPR
jgi:hypothetical protein